jgi:hypothetical protein
MPETTDKLGPIKGDPDLAENPRPFGTLLRPLRHVPPSIETGDRVGSTVPENGFFGTSRCHVVFGRPCTLTDSFVLTTI